MTLRHKNAALVRVVLSRKAGWRMPPNTVKVCRPTKYGNPHRVGWCPVCGTEHTHAEAVEEFRAMLKLAEIPCDLSELRGKNLACWCKAGTPCHADVLLLLANKKLSKRPSEAKSSRLAQRKGNYVQRRVRHCGCKYQKEKSWGYRIFKWVGGRKSWKPTITAASPGMAEILADDYKRVLIVCLGCGADMVREYAPNSEESGE